MPVSEHLDLGHAFTGEHAHPAPLNYKSRALEAFAVVKTGDGRLYGFTVTSTNNAAAFIQGFDAAALPADGALPLFSFPVAADSVCAAQWIPWRTLDTGLVLCTSSTNATKTLGSADCIFDVQYL